MHLEMLMIVILPVESSAANDASERYRRGAEEAQGDRQKKGAEKEEEGVKRNHVSHVHKTRNLV